MARDIHWKLQQSGLKFQNHKGTTIRELVRVDGMTTESGHYRPTTYWTVHWKLFGGLGKKEGTCKWQSWQRWAEAEWVAPPPPRPVPLPVPEVSDVEMAFPTNKHTPPWHWVPNEFKANGDPEARHENRDNLWCKVASVLAFGTRNAHQWKILPKEGIDPQKAVRAICETLGSWRDRVEIKIASTAYMLSEWFEDCWWEGDTHTAIGNTLLTDLIEEDSE